MLFKKANANENEVQILKRDIIEETRCLIKCLPLLCINFFSLLATPLVLYFCDF